MTAKNIRDARAFQDELMAERIAAGFCPRCGFRHAGPADDAACDRKWKASTKRTANRKVDGVTVYPSFGAANEDCNS